MIGRNLDTVHYTLLLSVLWPGVSHCIPDCDPLAYDTSGVGSEEYAASILTGNIH
jgi:hypothetical protein